MRFLSILLACLLVSISNGHELRGRDAVTAPNCSTTCLSTYIPKYCGSITNDTCACTNTNLAAAVTACAAQSCTVVELLQLQKYTAVSCGVENDKTRLHMVLHVDYVIPFLTFCFLGGRIIGRILLGVGLGSDDWTMVASFICYLSAVGTSLGLVLHGFGEHTFWLSQYQITTALKYFYITELLYILSNTLTKLSLLLFFLRIFPNRQFRLQVQIVSALVVLTGLAFFISLAFQCAPIYGYWTNWYLPQAARTQCINQYAALYAGSGLSILQNIVIFILPISTLWRLKLSSRRRINVLVMFSVGSGVVVFSFLRLPSLGKLKQSRDISYDQASIIVYSHLEQAFGIICACLPACRSLLEYFFPALKSKLDGSDEPRLGSRYANGSKTVMGGSKIAIGRSRMNTSSRSLVDKDVDVEARAENTELDLLQTLGSGKHGMSHTNVAAIGMAQTTDDHDGGAEEKESRVKSWPSRMGTNSKSDGFIIMTMTVEQSNESVEEARSRHERENSMEKTSRRS